MLNRKVSKHLKYVKYAFMYGATCKILLQQRSKSVSKRRVKKYYHQLVTVTKSLDSYLIRKDYAIC